MDGRGELTFNREDRASGAICFPLCSCIEAHSRELSCERPGLLRISIPRRNQNKAKHPTGKAIRSNHENTRGHFHETSPKPILSHPPLPSLLRPRESVQNRTTVDGCRANRRPESSQRIPGTSLTCRIAESTHPEDLCATKKLRNLSPAVWVRQGEEINLLRDLAAGQSPPSPRSSQSVPSDGSH
jgi:hypothetical protein